MAHASEKNAPIIDWLTAQKGKGAVSLKHGLEQCFFSSASRRCLIIQPEQRQAVYFMDAKKFDDPKIQGTQIQALRDMTGHIAQLNRDGAITLFDVPEQGKDDTIFLSQDFADPHRKDKKFILNKQGLFSAHPQSIQNANDQVTHRGVKLTGETYELVRSCLTSNVVVTPRLASKIKIKGKPAGRLRKVWQKLKSVWVEILFAGLLIAIGTYVLNGISWP